MGVSYNFLFAIYIQKGPRQENYRSKDLINYFNSSFI